MKRLLLGLASLAVVLGSLMAVPSVAKAETSFSFSMSDSHHRPSYRESYRHHSYRPSRHEFRHHYRPRHHGHSAAFYAPVPYYYAPAPRPIVYQTTVVSPVRYVSQASLLADPASPSYTNGVGQMCREYQSTGLIGGSPQSTYGTACLQPDGAWRVVD